MANAVGVIKETTSFLQIMNGVANSLGSDGGMEEGGVCVTLTQPTDTRLLPGYGLLLPVKIGELSMVIDLHLNHPRAQWVKSHRTLDRVQGFSATRNVISRAPKHLPGPCNEMSPERGQLLDKKK